MADYMTYGELATLFRTYESTNPKHHLTGYITFTADSFKRPYSLLSRTYMVSSNNKAFIPSMGGYSIFGSSLDGTDPHVRLDAVMASEHGGNDGWKVEYCTLTAPKQPVVLEGERPEFLGQLVDIVEDFLAEHDVRIKNDERDTDPDPDGAAIIYGSDYDELRERFTHMMTAWHVLDSAAELENANEH